MNVLLRSHEDTELSISAPSCRAPQDRVRYQLRRHSNCGPSSELDMDKDKSRSRSCSPVRRLLQVTSQTWGSMKSTGSSSSNTRKSFSSILFANKDNSNSSSKDEPVDPTEVDSLDFSHASSRSLLMGSQQGLSSSMKQLELAKEQEDSSNLEKQEKQQQRGKGSASQQKQQSQRQTPAQEGSSSTSTTAGSSTTRASNNSSPSAVPFPPDGTKRRRSRKRSKRRKGTRTRQCWEDLLEVHQRMTNTLPAATHEPLTAAVLHRRVLERKRLNARKLKLKIKFLEAPPETKVQSKLDKQPRRKSLPASPPKPADEPGDKRKKRRMRRSSTADVDATGVRDLTQMKTHLRRKADAQNQPKKEEAAFVDTANASAPCLRRPSSSKPLQATSKPNTPASPLPKKQQANVTAPTSPKNSFTPALNPAWRKNQKAPSIPPNSPKSASTSNANTPASHLPKKPKATSNPPTSPKSTSTSKPNLVSPSPKEKKASTPLATSKQPSTIPTSSPPASKRLSAKSSPTPSSPTKRAHKNKERLSALSNSSNHSLTFYEEIPKCIKRGSLGLGKPQQAAPLNKPKTVPPTKKRDSLEATTTPRRLSRVERNSLRKEGISPKQLQELQKASLEADPSEDAPKNRLSRSERNSITRKQEEEQQKSKREAPAPNKSDYVDENTAPSEAPVVTSKAVATPAELGYEEASNDAPAKRNTCPSRSLTPSGQRRTRRMTGLRSRPGLRRSHTADDDLVVKRPSFPTNDRRGSLHESFPSRQRRASRRPSFPCNGTRFSSVTAAPAAGDSNKDKFDRCMTR